MNTPPPPKALDKASVERLEDLPNPFRIILSCLKRTGMRHSEAKLWASNYTYPQVADDIIGRIGHMLRPNRPPSKTDDSARS